MKKQKSNLRILLVVPHTKPEYSGSGLNAYHFAQFLNRNGSYATLLTFSRNFKFKLREYIGEVPVHRIPYLYRNPILKILSMVFIFPSYVFHILRHDIILIYGSHIIGYQFLILLGRFFGKKTIFRSLLMGSDDMETIIRKNSRIFQRLTVSLLKMIDLYFAINPEFALRYTKYTGQGDKVLLCPQGVDISAFSPKSDVTATNIRLEHGIKDKCFVILSVGFLIHRKGFAGVFAVLNNLDFEYKYIVAGEHNFEKGHFMSGYAEEAGELRKSGISILGDKLILEGPIENIRLHYLMTDLVLINSSSEGLPNTMLEAMACGKVVLIRNIPGIGFIVEHMVTGAIFNDDSEMRTLIEIFRDDPELRLRVGRNASQYIRSNASFDFTWSAIQDKVEIVKQK